MCGGTGRRAEAGGGMAGNRFRPVRVSLTRAKELPGEPAITFETIHETIDASKTL